MAGLSENYQAPAVEMLPVTHLQSRIWQQQCNESCISAIHTKSCIPAEQQYNIIDV